jgi:hypothetical protein
MAKKRKFCTKKPQNIQSFCTDRLVSKSADEAYTAQFQPTMKVDKNQTISQE